VDHLVPGEGEADHHLREEVVAEGDHHHSHQVLEGLEEGEDLHHQKVGEGQVVRP